MDYKCKFSKENCQAHFHHSHELAAVTLLHSLAEHPGLPDPTGHLVPGPVLVLARWHPLPQLSWYFIPTMVGRPHWLPSSQVLGQVLGGPQAGGDGIQPSQLYSAHNEELGGPKDY